MYLVNCILINTEVKRHIKLRCLDSGKRLNVGQVLYFTVGFCKASLVNTKAILSFLWWNSLVKIHLQCYA